MYIPALENFRQWLERNSKIAGIAVASVLVIVIAVMIFRSTRHPGISDAYFLDTETGEISVLAGTQVPPLAGKSGQPTLVIASCQTCDSCGNRKVVYLMKYTDNGKKAMEAQRDKTPTTLSVTDDDMLVRLPGPNDQWVSSTTAAGQQIMNTTLPCANGATAKVCLP